MTVTGASLLPNSTIGVVYRALGVALTASALVGCAAHPALAPPGSPPAVVWQYEVVLGEDGNLAVEAVFSGPVKGGLSIEPGAQPFVDQLGLDEGTSFRALGLRDDAWRSACTSRCRVRYRFRLKEAATALGDVELALAAGPTLFAPPSTWLVRPSKLVPGRYRFHVTTPPTETFATGVRHSPSDASGTFEARTEDLAESNFAAFGPLRTHRIAEGVDVLVSPGSSIPDESIRGWAKTEFDLVTGYFGRPSANSLSVFVLPGTSEVSRGVTLGGGGASILFRIGTGVTKANLMSDWVLCHELIHVAFPETDPRQAWFGEGLATYVEPVIRARAGLVSKVTFWKELVEGLPQGLPAPGDRGLAHDDSWGRTYWGGALYFLLADLGIRERTAGSRSLQDAVAAVAARGNVETFVALDDILAIGDRATGTNVLKELYARLARAPGREDLDALWQRLGIVREGGTVGFDENARDAKLRDAILNSATSPHR
jgi:hypothetical protein